MKQVRSKTKSQLPIETEKSAGAVIFHRGKQIEYLLLLSNFWGFCKGHLEPGETERQAARREIREETGLEASLTTGFRAVDNYWYQRQRVRVKKQAIFFLAEAPTRDSKISWEHTESAWLSFDDALARLTHENGRAVLRQAHAFLKRKNKK